MIWFVINIWINYSVKRHWPGRDGQNLSGIFAEYIAIFNNRKDMVHKRACLILQHVSVLIISWIGVFLSISSNFKPCFLSRDHFELHSSIIFCRMQEIWGDIFTLSHSWQQSIVTLQYYAVQTRAFLGKEGVYTLVYSATKILKYWGCFLSLVMHVRKHMTSSDRENVPYWALLFGGSLKLQITATVTQRMLQNSKETKAKACRSLLFWSTFTSLTLSKLKNKPI